MAVKQDGTLWATGLDEYGQFGDGSWTNSFTFKQVLSGVKTVGLGGFHTMVVTQDDSLWATGINGYGRLGDGEPVM